MKLVDWKTLKKNYGIPYSRQHIARLEADRKFPLRVTLGQCRVAWVEAEVVQWIEERIKKRDASR